MQNYYYAFSDHPLVVPHIHVNDPAVNATWISSALRGVRNDILPTISNKIVELRDSEPFTSLEAMKERLEKLVSVDQIFVAQKISKADIKKIKTSTLQFNFFSVSSASTTTITTTSSTTPTAPKKPAGKTRAKDNKEKSEKKKRKKEPKEEEEDTNDKAKQKSKKRNRVDNGEEEQKPKKKRKTTRKKHS